jgi:hypothetical protein
VPTAGLRNKANLPVSVAGWLILARDGCSPVEICGTKPIDAGPMAVFAKRTQCDGLAAPGYRREVATATDSAEQSQFGLVPTAVLRNEANLRFR